MASCYDPQYPNGREAQLAIFEEKGEGSYEHEKGVRTDGQVWSWKPTPFKFSKNMKYQVLRTGFIRKRMENTYIRTSFINWAKAYAFPIESLSHYLGIAKMDTTCHSKAFMINSFNYHHRHFLQTCWNHVSEWSKGPPREGFFRMWCASLRTFCPYHSWNRTYFVSHEKKQQNQEDLAEWV